MGTSIGLNSLFNVMVYFCRLKGLRQHVGDMIRSTKVLMQRKEMDVSEPDLSIRNQAQNIDRGEQNPSRECTSEV